MLDRLTTAVIAGMKVVRANQGRPTTTAVKQTDGTQVTPTDKQSQAAMLEVLQGIPGTYIHAEESDRHTVDAPVKILVDPMDGTRAFAIGLATSTVIAATYDHNVHKVTRCVIGEPATGRIWSASDITLTQLLWHNFATGENSAPIQVGNEWDGKRTSEVNEQLTILVDVSHGFKRAGRQILTDAQTAKLFASLNGEVKILLPGSNGLHQALVANGARSIAGSLTLAIGGPWDVCGSLLVEQAGGFCRAFKKELFSFTECDPLDVLAYDVLVTGNSPQIVDYLCDKVLRV
ncbi:MAG: inositol monophosphatase family protein [Patescibacteria group bacterium]